MIATESPPGPKNSSTAPCESGCELKTTNDVNSNYTLSDLVKTVPIWKIHPAPENDDVYGVISPNDPEVIQLAKSIKQNGLQEPILISRDKFIISGHRRLVACRLAKLDHVQVRVHPISRSENKEAFVKLLVEITRNGLKARRF
jgi:hypothetical protein